MSKLRDLSKFLKSVTVREQEEALTGIIYGFEQDILDMNTFQLLEGKKSDGQKIKPAYRSKSYERYKLTLNPMGTVDLRLTGAFHDSFFIKQTNKFPVIIFASDEKTNQLVTKYGKEIFGLDNENKNILVKEHIREEIIQFYKNLFQL